VLVTEADGTLGLVEHGLVVLVRVAGESVTHRLGGRLMRFGLHGGGSRVGLALDGVGSLLGSGLL